MHFNKVNQFLAFYIKLILSTIFILLKLGKALQGYILNFYTFNFASRSFECCCNINSYKIHPVSELIDVHIKQREKSKLRLIMLK